MTGERCAREPRNGAEVPAQQAPVEAVIVEETRVVEGKPMMEGKVILGRDVPFPLMASGLSSLTFCQFFCSIVYKLPHRWAAHSIPLKEEGLWILY